MLKYTKAQPLVEDACMWQYMSDTWTNVFGHENTWSRLWKFTSWRFVYGNYHLILQYYAWMTELNWWLNSKPWSWCNHVTKVCQIQYEQKWYVQLVWYLRNEVKPFSLPFPSKPCIQNQVLWWWNPLKKMNKIYALNEL